ncbi:hypothetical protein FZ103_04450 [Streptomonospora sp. PA3]|uniref:hypothetical protein n=1 Tax=Streptomonospora sp. PA3 TaxID=2607326 RepID=UPI0012DBDE9E|nr:hypothetical protein [Streptomonospora sp. PA3]MUL40436.1 hypothetical protein [Streptomonospora sp. PA3]
MERGSSKHSPKLDDELEGEIQGMLKGNKPTRAEEDHEPEPIVTDDGAPATDPAAVDSEGELPEDRRMSRGETPEGAGESTEGQGGTGTDRS